MDFLADPATWFLQSFEAAMLRWALTAYLAHRLVQRWVPARWLRPILGHDWR